MKDVAALILAAGKGTRMKSKMCKVLHTLAGRPMISYVTEAVRKAGVERCAIVVGHDAEAVRACVDGPGLDFALQSEQLGTGHAVSVAGDLFADFDGDLVILYGDVPLIQPDTIRDLIDFHRMDEGRLTVMTTIPECPTGYGRIIKDDSGLVLRIVEERDADKRERAVTEINTGIYVVESPLVFRLLERIKPENDQGEFYLTDIVEEAVKDSVFVRAFCVAHAHEVAGINTRHELAEATAAVWESLRMALMASGVTLLDPSTVYPDYAVQVGPDTVIHPNVSLLGSTRIGRDCVIESGVMINDCLIGDGVTVKLGSRLDSARVDHGTSIGPMAHLRPQAEIGKNARVGNFVEVKKSFVGDGSKASHLTYLGDSTIGKNVNIGCGTITCNYDGRRKHQTIIEDNCFVGSDVQFVAPVKVGEGSLIGAGSTITRDVPPKSLAVARAKQKCYPLKNRRARESADEDRKP